MAPSKPAVSFLGLGAMGFGMATNLIKEGHSVTGFDVWAPTLDKFKEAGGNTATSPAEAAQGKAFCILMVATAQQAQSVLFQGDNPAVPSLPQGATLLLCSTVPCAYVQGLAKELAEAGRQDIFLIDSPVSGGTIRAADGTLSIMAGGSDEAIEKGLSLLQTMSDPKKLYLVKGGVGAGSNMKMCHQVLAANQILSASEALGFATHLGLDLKTASDAVLKSEGRSWMFENRLPRLLASDFKPVASAVTIILKDAGIITSEARRYKFPSPMTSTAEQVYFTALGRGWGADDDASVLRLYSEGVGKVGPVTGSTTNDKDKIDLVLNLLKGIHLCSAAETIAFANHVGLDLDQVFELCTNAAGGSLMLDIFGPDMVKAFKGSKAQAAKGWTARDNDPSQQLSVVAGDLQAAVDEAQRLKTPLFLGNQALNVMRLALQDESQQLASAAVVKAWLA
ncbi:hypothetical protein N0V93_010076 [Gnomoniopsis smithogilvyi]|uniref:3-hydroxyisobutyrate dehydrogenase n=1 Tax=Gnomoniopsis smithogilvyi TaxID=1191159 RepID=A0A9W9CT25_9PEZI|nr:hypothetical protein N0V93_010076 [Gnomoniopsis smithogilvyi]